MGTFLQAFWGKINKMAKFKGTKLKIRGQLFVPQNDLATSLDSKFNLDYDVATKHDPIQSDDWVMDTCAMPKWRWAPNMSILLEEDEVLPPIHTKVLQKYC